MCAIPCAFGHQPANERRVRLRRKGGLIQLFLVSLVFVSLTCTLNEEMKEKRTNHSSVWYVNVLYEKLEWIHAIT
jgi:hypothetical protein